MDTLQLNPKTGSVSEKIYLVGAHDYSKIFYIKLIQKYQLEVKVAKHLATSYGDRAEDVAKMTPFLKPLATGSSILEAEVIYAVRNEYAQKASDVLARRTRLAFLDVRQAYKALPRVVELMGKELNWSKERQAQEFKETETFLLTMGLQPKDIKK